MKLQHLFFFGCILSFTGCGPGIEKAPPVLLSANFVRPDQVNAVSKFNSCCGHAYPQQDSPRSGKNYFWPNSTNYNSSGKIRLYAACTGSIKQTAQDTSNDRGSTVHLFCENSSTAVRYFHGVYDVPLPSGKISAGSPIGYADVSSTSSPCPSWAFCTNFDVAVSDDSDDTTVNYFSKLDSASMAEWNNRGLSDPNATNISTTAPCANFSCNVSDSSQVFSFSPAY